VKHLKVNHKDGRIGYIVHVDEIRSDIMYYFRYKRSEHLTYVGELVSGRYLTAEKNFPKNLFDQSE